MYQQVFLKQANCPQNMKHEPLLPGNIEGHGAHGYPERIPPTTSVSAPMLSAIPSALNSVPLRSAQTTFKMPTLHKAPQLHLWPMFI